jgi:hypothetical protein
MPEVAALGNRADTRTADGRGVHCREGNDFKGSGRDRIHADQQRASSNVPAATRRPRGGRERPASRQPSPLRTRRAPHQWVDEGNVVEGLALIPCGALGPFAHGRVAAGREEHDRDRRAQIGESLLHVEAAHPSQLDIQDEAVEPADPVPREKFLTGSERRHLKSDDTEESSQGAAEGGIIVNDTDMATHAGWSET